MIPGVPRVAVWAAVSTEAQATEDKDSLPAQIASGRTWAADMRAEVVAVYTVPGHSRDTIFLQDAAAQMPAYRALWDDCQQRTFDVLWCRERSRLGRTDALIAQVEAVVHQAGAEVYSASMPHSLGSGSETSAIFLSAVERASAQAENVQRRERHIIGCRARVRRGLPYAIWAYGYRAVRDPATGKAVGGEFDPDEIGAVEQATTMFLNGRSFLDIALALNQTRYRPRRSRRWTDVSAHYMMHCDLYAGFVTCGQVRNEQRSSLFPALWDEHTYQAVLRERARRHPGGRAPGWAISGIVYCARCGWRMSGANDDGIVRFRCNRENKRRMYGACHHNYIRGDVIEDAIDAMLVSLRELDHEALVQMVTQSTPQIEVYQRQQRDAQADMHESERRLERLALAVAAGTIDARAARTANDTLLADYDAAAARLQEIEARLALLPDPQQQTDAALRLLDEIPSIRDAPVEVGRRALLDAGVRVWVEAGCVVRIEIGAA